MRFRTLRWTAAIPGFIVLLVMASGVIEATIVGSAHDLSTAGWNTSGEICIVCHTPHNALVAVPLWNHSDTAETFTMYSNPDTIDGAQDAQPSGVSKRCLSCHDGVTNVDAFGGSPGVGVKIVGDANLGTDLSNDHPISIVYDSAADPELFPTTNAYTGSTTIGDHLFGGKVECASCHDVHDDTNGYFLLKPNTGSALCLTCHDK